MPLRLSTGKQTDSRLNFNFTQKRPAGQYPVCRLFISPAKIRQTAHTAQNFFRNSNIVDLTCKIDY